LTSQHVAEIGDAEELNELQKQALDLIKAKKNVFVTGPAGTGKGLIASRITLKYVRNTYKRHEWVATASTGSAAIPLGGQTLHSFAGVGVPGVVKDFEKAWNKSDKWRGLQVLIIDEISMISGEFLDLLSNVVSQIRGKQMQPFGGIQLIFCGDFLQLPPIPKSLSGHRHQQDALASRGMNPSELVLNRGFAFQSLCWRDAKINVEELKEVFRQKNSAFITVLHEIRTGKVSSDSKAFLAGCNRPIPPNSLGILPTVLYSKNINVTNHNMAHLDKLSTELHTFQASDGIDADDEAPHWAADALWNDSFFKSCIAESGLSLKEGAQVMLIKNENMARGPGPKLVNGSRGQVVDFVDGTDLDPGDAEDLDLHEFSLPNMKFFPVVQFLNGSRRIIRPEKFESDIVGLGSCFRKAIPLKLAWAVTVHKSQGLTLDYVVADVGNVFAEAQTYVALSRASDENGLELRNFSENKVFANSRALSFYANEHVPLWNEKPTFADVDSADEPKPQGAPDCLAGKTFVFSGELNAMPRYEAETFVQKYGGVTRTAVSGKTNFLVIGNTLEDGRDTKTGSKYRKATQIIESGDKNKSNLKIIIDKRGLYELIGPS